MMKQRRFHQVDVFSAVPMKGNPLAVVHSATEMTDSAMAEFARWTNLSETTFLLPPTDPSADYHLRIFTPASELPFAGHPTLPRSGRSSWGWWAPTLPVRPVYVVTCIDGWLTL